MNYIFDTNIVISLHDSTLKYQHSNLHKKMSSLKSTDNIYISILTLYELEYGISNANLVNKDLYRLTAEKTKKDFQILPLTEKGAYVYGELKTALRKTRKISRENIKKYNIDLMLASTAIAQSCILVSDDKIFEILSEINSNFKFQNWLN